MSEPIIRMYYDHLKRGEIIGAKCNKCEKLTFPPTTRCEHCGSDNIEWFLFSGKGQLMYVSHGMAPPPNPRFEKIAPYGYGHIKLDEGVFTQAIITNVGADPKELNEYFEKGPVDVVADIIELEGLPILAFKVV
jgi:uncharacterized protein